MEDFQTRQIAVQSIRTRIAPVAGTWLSDSECVQVALACACRGAKELLGVLFTRNVTKKIECSIETLAITDAEWKMLYASETTHTRTNETNAVANSIHFKEEALKLSNALRSTIGESAQKTSWTRPVARVSIYVGMHFANYEDAVSTALGGLVRSDNRRLEDLCAEMEDRGVQVMELAMMISALSVAAC